jgi:hypothetical protein
MDQIFDRPNKQNVLLQIQAARQILHLKDNEPQHKPERNK